jgi:CRISP-associated protein Cas1
MDNPPLIPVMGLHALSYCERLFYLEQVERILIADAAVFAGRTLHRDIQLEEEESGRWASVEVTSEKLGLIGKVDCLRKRDGSIIPYEHKRGRVRKENKQAVAWPSDALQVSAYAMMIEECEGKSIDEGRVHYHHDNITVRVPLDEDARQSVISAINRARELMNSVERPPITRNEKLCVKCSLAPVCLPEEERFAEDKSWEPIRLFPADIEGKTLHIISNSAHIGRTGESLKIESREGDKTYHITNVTALVLHGYPQVTTQAIHLCAKYDVPIHWISGGGYYTTGLINGQHGVQRKLRQYKALVEPDFCLELAKKMAVSKIKSALRYVLRVTRGSDRQNGKVEESLTIMRTSMHNISRANNLDSIRGHEGMAGRAYFAVIPELIKENVPAEMHYSGRSRRPPKDRFNALLSFGYSLLYQAVLQAIMVVGLEPAIGFFHTPRTSAHPLVMDIMELFRVLLWDMVVIGSVNRMQWNPDLDFNVTPEKVWLSAEGKKKAITLFEKRLEETWKHPVIGYSLSYSRLIELEVRLLEKEWTGQPGLFARMDLR